MKQLFTPVAIIVALIAFFVIIDRKEFCCLDDVRTKSTVDDRRPTSISTPEMNLISEVKHANGKLAEEQTSIKTNHDDKTMPKAIPVVTPEAAEKLNASALTEFVVFENKAQTEQKRLERGYHLAFFDNFKRSKSITLTKANEDRIKSQGYSVKEFKKKEIPNNWTIDYATIPPDASFNVDDNGFTIVSDQGAIRLIGQRMDGMCSSFILELTVKNNSDRESEFILYIHDSGMLKNGYKPFASEKIPGKSKKTIEVELGVFEQLANIAPAISVRGALTLSELAIFRKDHEDFTLVEGEITERSELPDPNDMDYPDCRYTAHFVGHMILSGLPCNKEVALSIDGFSRKKVLPTNSLKAGDKIKCAIVPIDSLPEELASIQEADDLSLFELDSYYVTTYSTIASYTNPSSLDVANMFVSFKSDVFDYRSVFDRGFNPPVPDKLRDAQKSRIKADLDKSNAMIRYIEENREQIEQKFQDAWSREKARYSDGTNIVVIEDKNNKTTFYWRKIGNSFWCLLPYYTLIPEKPGELSKDNLNALVSFRDFLESNGIQFIVALIPEWYTISSRIINQDFMDVPVLELATLVKQLSEAGIECPYSAAQIIKNRDLYPFAYLFPNDSHPASTVHYSISEILADRLSDSQFPKSLSKGLFTHVPTTKKFNDSENPHVFPSNCDIGNNTPGVLYPVDEIFYDGKLVKKDPSSEILVIGNSYIHSPAGNQHSFLATLSEQLLYPVDEFLSYGHGPKTTVIQRFLENPEMYLKNKKMVILVCGTSYFLSETVPWSNIMDMDRKRLLLNGKKLVATLKVSSNATSIDNSNGNAAWNVFPNKSDVILKDDTKMGIFDGAIPNIDTSKPLVCIIETVRLPISSTPVLFVNGIGSPIPATILESSLYWQNTSFSLPHGTKHLKIEIQGKKGTVIGFNKILIYQ